MALRRFVFGTIMNFTLAFIIISLVLGIVIFGILAFLTLKEN